ncbi:malate dehydrogenase [Rozella allomycis CSF55]|uniref:Malate dehydrogenase n=1 Tax=Rozella allomycis (strain CSF55) TaxID=988480 RepID=A0A075ASJ5_ROZAC|nr:L-lactate/malate dehydrogenase domain-containing protein [Rozella allomycis CSF55]RKP16413.1 malate dehydrogenase [Rozella allomycis CSF55]|eukprot:EPZ33233.1 L-lactate/malate dehydrogenase domain-containing protein [Rozella allomycis CSF55]
MHNILVPVKVVITGAAGQIAYSLLFHVCSGQIFGNDQVRFMQIPSMISQLEGVRMELEDCAFPLLNQLSITDNLEEAFKDADYAFLIGALPRKQFLRGMERKDLLKSNASIFRNQGLVIDNVAKKSIKILVVGNPANTNAYILNKSTPSIPSKNISALTRLDQNRATFQISKTLGVPNVVVWGNHSNTQFPDPKHALFDDGRQVWPILKAKFDEPNFIETVQNRGTDVIKARKLSSAMSAAKACADHMRDWCLGTKQGEIVSMAVVSNGNMYGIPKDIVFSVPVTCNNGEWKLVEGIELDFSSKKYFESTLNELKQEALDAEFVFQE